MMKNTYTQQKGMTLVELMIALSIVAIIAVFSSGSWSKFFAKQAVSTDVMALISAINSAKNHSITHKTVTRICGVDTTHSNMSSEKVCLRDWSQLAITTMQGDDSELIHTLTLHGNYQQVRWSAFQNKPQLDIAATGFTAHQNGTLYLCHARFDELNRSITVSKSGRIRVQKQTEKLEAKCA